MQYHLDLLRDVSNGDLYKHLRSIFQKRGQAGEEFLVSRFHQETDGLRGDILQLLGHLCSEAAAPIAREFLEHQDSDHRCRGCMVLGWIGGPEDIALLGKHLLDDPDPSIRGDAATALRQIWLRLPECRDESLGLLRQALSKEQDPKTLNLIIISAQTIAKKSFGMRENISAGTITRDVTRARAAALRYLSS